MGEHGVELFGGVASQDEAIIDAHGFGGSVDIEADVVAFDPFFGIFIAGPHFGVDDEVTATGRPAFRFGLFAFEGF